MRRSQRKRELAELKKKLEISEKKKQELVNYFQKLKEAYSSKKISYAQYVESIYKRKGNRNLLEWIKYYDNYIKNCRELINKQKTIVLKNKIPVVIVSIIFALIITISIFYVRPT